MSVIKHNNNVNTHFVMDLMTLFISQNKYLKSDKIQIIYIIKKLFVWHIDSINNFKLKIVFSNIFTIHLTFGQARYYLKQE